MPTRALASLLMAGLASCQAPAGEDVTSSRDGGGRDGDASSILDAPLTPPIDAPRADAPATIVVAHPVETPYAVFRNPGMGWLAYAFDPVGAPTAVQITPYSSAVYTNYFTWADLEPTEGRYDFSAIDRLIDAWAPSGRRIKIGIHVTDPTSIPRPHVPGWFLALPGAGRWYDRWYGVPIAPSYAPYPGATPGYDWEPHYEDARFVNAFGAMLAALGEHYRATPRWQRHLESVDVSTYGFWGEWHSDYPWPAGAREPTLRALVDQYFTAFAGSPAPHLTMNAVGSSLSPADALAVDRNSVHYALGRGADPVRRCIGICGAGYLAADERAEITAALATGAFQGEWGSWDGSIARFTDGPGGPSVGDTQNAIDEALTLHANYLGWYVSEEWVSIATCPAWTTIADCGDNPSGRYIRVLRQPARSSDVAESLEDYAQRRLGYRLALHALRHPDVVEPGASMSVLHTWFQRGVGRVPFALGFLLCLESEAGPEPRARYCAAPDRSFDPSGWPAGEPGSYSHGSELVLPAAIPPGSYALLVALVGPGPEPFVNLAIEGKIGSDPNTPDFYRVSTIEVR